MLIFYDIQFGGQDDEDQDTDTSILNGDLRIFAIHGQKHNILEIWNTIIILLQFNNYHMMERNGWKNNVLSQINVMNLQR